MGSHLYKANYGKQHILTNDINVNNRSQKIVTKKQAMEECRTEGYSSLLSTCSMQYKMYQYICIY